MAVRCEYEGDVEPLGVLLVALDLLEAVRWRLVLRLGLEDRDGDGLGFRRHLDSEGVVGSAVCLASRLPVNDLNGSERLFPADHVLGPTARVQRRIDQLDASLRLVEQVLIVRIGGRATADRYFGPVGVPPSSAPSGL